MSGSLTFGQKEDSDCPVTINSFVEWHKNSQSLSVRFWAVDMGCGIWSSRAESGGVQGLRSGKAE